MAHKPRLETVEIYLGGAAYDTIHQVGALPHWVRFFNERGVTIKLLWGASGGGVNAAHLGQAENQEELFELSVTLKEIWKLIVRMGPMSVIPFDKWALVQALILLKSEVMDHSSPRKMLDGSLFAPILEVINKERKKLKGPLIESAAINWKKLVAPGPTKIPTYIGLLNESSGDNEFFSTLNRRTDLPHDQEMYLATLASMSIRGFFSNVKIGPMFCSDSGHVDLRMAKAQLGVLLLPYLEKEPVKQGDRWVSQIWPFKQFYINSAKTRQLNAKEIERATENAELERQLGRQAPEFVTMPMSRRYPSMGGYTFYPNEALLTMELGEHDFRASREKVEEKYSFA